MVRLPIRLKANFHFLGKLTLIFLFIQTLTRSILLIERAPNFIELVDVYLDGLLWDLYAWIILSLPLLFLSVLLPKSLINKFNNSKIEKLILFFVIYGLLFIGFCELTFWNEFHSRFNFIAVDYLIYTNEVLANIRESYPMGIIIFSITTLSALFTYLFTKMEFKFRDESYMNPAATLTLFGLVIPAISLISVGPWLEIHEPDFHEDQLSRNGMVEFFRAFRSNQIDYKAFYATRDESIVSQIINSHKLEQSAPIVNIKNKRPNIIFITVESLGAKFIAPLGGQPTTTPHLNQLANESIFFTNFYATGTRTVRGLEAINLSIPPTPGYAVVKRPEHKNLYSLGNTFKSNKYDPLFIYGGNGFFDNMNSFFEGNGFRTIDLSDFKKDEITFKNAWGVCDEDLFNKALSEMDKRNSSSKPSLMFLLTTSNHRPFTYPDGKIDIKSGESRAGAVKYTDYAIGKFLKDSEKKTWFKDTIFIIVADHSTEGRGQFDLAMSDYHIPMWIYSPHLVTPMKIDKLASQIDILPSMIHLLGLNDQSPFFGKSVFDTNWKQERAFIGNYQYVGYYENKTLTTLGPNQIVRNFSYDPSSKSQTELDHSDYINEAIAYYQHASHLLDKGKYKLESK